MKVIEKNTCIKFIRRTNETDYIDIISDDGCWSYVGRQGGDQSISLENPGCLARGTIQHEVFHALGYDHMQNHEDRDKFIDINWKNIREDEKHNFEPLRSDVSNFNTSYDFLSVMHYPTNAFAIDRKIKTMTPKEEYNEFKDLMGQRTSLSKDDARRLNRMYSCENVKYN